ncbi:MAG: type II secretion system F family protein [Azoarcus sp.]|jgi:type IV pilus assembly protein PilC|nr:type II secretion system F family protein [Azoarcus sp.]
MSRYRYRACDTHGRIVQGETQALNPSELETRLRERGLEPIHVKPASWLSGRQRVSRRELIHFCFHLEQMFGAGVPILDVLADFAEGQKQSGIKAIASDLHAEVERGQPLSSAMKQHPQVFDEVFRCMLHAGEATGDIAPVLRQIAADLARADEIRANARKIVIYPLVVGSVLSVAIVVALTQVVPQVAILFRSNGQELPLSTRLLIGFSDWFSQYAWLLPPTLIVLTIAISMIAARRPLLRRRLHALALRLPLIGPITQRLILARTASLLAMLYASGITVIDALASTARATPNLSIRYGIEAAGAHIAAGRGIASAFESTGLFPRLVTRMLRVGEQTGRLDSALGQLVYFYERDAREAIERLQASIEPALTIVMGLLMFWIAIAVLGPIYDIITRLPV